MWHVDLIQIHVLLCKKCSRSYNGNDVTSLGQMLIILDQQKYTLIDSKHMQFRCMNLTVVYCTGSMGHAYKASNKFHSSVQKVFRRSAKEEISALVAAALVLQGSAVILDWTDASAHSTPSTRPLTHSGFRLRVICCSRSR